MDYVEQMQSLITKTIINIAIIFALIIVIIGIIWIAPCCYYKKHKNDIKKSVQSIKTSLIAQATLTAICLLLSLTTISSFQAIGNMRKDIEEQSFITYDGSYDIANSYHFTFSASELWFDLRAVTIEDDTEPLWFDMMNDIGIDPSDTGTIVYGKNSRYVVSIESEAES